MRFPYAVVCALFAMPDEADADTTALRRISTFQRARMLLSTINGRAEYSSPGEKFEDVTMMLFNPLRGQQSEPRVRLFAATPGSGVPSEIPEHHYFRHRCDLYNARNPHAQIGVEKLEGEDAE
jgi:hypothetical protein